MTRLSTARLDLLPFTEAHIAGLNAMNADPEVMRYLTGQPETLEQTAAVVARVQRRWAQDGYSWWSLVERASGEIVGAGVLQNLRREAAPEPDPSCPVEIGWRLRRDRWGRGLASEAAQAIARFAFEGLHLPELYAVCDPDNHASARVMQRLGMRDAGLQTWYGRSLQTYRLSAAEWSAGATGATGTVS